MTEPKRVEVEGQLLPDGAAAQALEAASEPQKPNTKLVIWGGSNWMVRSKPGARFLAAYEDDKVMTAIGTVLGDEQYAKLLEMDPDVEGDDGVEGFIAACNRVWGVNPGN